MNTQDVKDVNRILNTAYRVQDLIDELTRCDPEAVVVFGCNYGDRGKTEQAIPVADVTEMDYGCETIDKSPYSQSGLAIKNSDDDTDFTDKEYTQHKIVILR